MPSIAAACKGINEGVAAFLAHLTARAVKARPADASVALTELQRLQSTLAVSDWQYRLPPVDVSASDGAAPANNGAPTNVGNPVPPAPPAPPTQQFDDRTRKLDRVKTNATTVMPVQQQNIDPEATTRFSLPADGIVNSLDNAVDSAASQSPIAQSDESGNTPNSKSAKKRRTPLIVAGVVALLLACGAGGWAWWYYQGPGSYWTMPQPDGMTCDASAACPITNVKWSDYESLLKISDIEYEVSKSIAIPWRKAISSPPTRRMSAIAAASVVARSQGRGLQGSPAGDGSRRYSRRDQRIRQGSNQRTEEGWIR